METKEILTKAADLIEERGLYKGGWYVDDEGQCLCTIGALRAAGGGEIVDRHARQGARMQFDVSFPEDPATFTAMTDAEKLLLKRLTDKGALPFALPDESWVKDSVPSWNDFKASQEEVVALLRETAATC